LTVPAGFTWQPVIRWGDPIFKDAPAFDLGKQTAAAQERQFGYNNDYSDILEIPGQQGPACAAVREPRIHQREHHVPGQHARGDQRGRWVRLPTA
jgi:secreted PhoX family phosphatase